MNRALRKQSMKRCAFRKRGGGFSTGPALLPVPTDDWTYTQKQLVNQPYDDCSIPSRTGQLFNQPNPGLTQVVMAGGGANSWGTWDPALNPELAQRAMAGGADWGYKPDLGPIQTPMAGGACGCSVPQYVGGRRTNTRKRGGGCGCMLQGGGRRANRRTKRTYRKMRGGMWRAVAVDPSVSVGGDGPNVAALHAGVPCDARAGTPNALSTNTYMPDPRAPADVYSLTPNQQGAQGPQGVQAGGAYSSGNGFSEGCYKAPGSMLPVYEAETAGFHFRPSTEFGSTLPDGVTAYNDVVPHAARLGGGKKRNTRRKKAKKASRKMKNRK